jgi:hypothetical protein
MSASEHNEAGYWESTPIRELNDRLLESAGSEWDDWLSVDPEWLHSPRAQAFVEEACAVVESEYHDSKLFVIKDPRICRIVPFWLEVLAQQDVQPLVILPLRNPMDVAASLEVRDNIDVFYSHLLWLHHVLEAEYHTRGIPRYFTTFDQLITHWGHSLTDAQSVLDVQWPRKPKQSTEEVDAYISEELRHHHEPIDKLMDDPSLSDWLRTASEIVFRWADGGEDARDYDQLDRIRHELNAAGPAFSELVARGRVPQRHAETLQAELTRVQSVLTQQNAQLTTLSQEHENVLRAIEELRGINQEMNDKLTLLQKEKDAEIAERDAEIAKKDAEIAKKDAEIASISRMLENREQQIGQLRVAAATQLGEAISDFLDRATWSLLGFRHTRRKMRALQHSGILDAEWYLRKHPDVKQSDVDPLQHYVEFGAHEGREPNATLANSIAET